MRDLKPQTSIASCLQSNSRPRRRSELEMISSKEAQNSVNCVQQNKFKITPNDIVFANCSRDEQYFMKLSILLQRNVSRNSQYKDVYRRRIEILQRTRIFRLIDVYALTIFPKSYHRQFREKIYIDLQQIVFFGKARLNCQYFHYTLGSNMQIYSKLFSSWKKRSFFTSIFSNMEISFKIIVFLRK